MKTFVQTLAVLALSVGLGLTLGKLAQAASPHSSDAVVIHEVG